MTGTRTPSAHRESHEAPSLVYTRDGANYKNKAWTWSAPGPMASMQHAERKEVGSSTPEFDDEDFRACWWPGDDWDWE
jgi:hypothetical protein